MAKVKTIRSKWLTVRLSENEEKKLLILFEKTTAQSLSEYARLVLLQEPVTVLYRNQSADELLPELVRLKNELNAIGNNFNQAVKRLHTIDHISEIKYWLLANEPVKNSFLQTAAEIRELMTKTYQLWLQK